MREVLISTGSPSKSSKLSSAASARSALLPSGGMPARTFTRTLVFTESRELVSVARTTFGVCVELIFASPMLVPSAWNVT